MPNCSVFSRTQAVLSRLNIDDISVNMPISRLWISTVLSLSFVIGSASHAQDIPRREAADKLLRDAITRQNLQGPQNPPIQFRARIHFEYRGSTAEGTYDLLWEKADRFRDTLQLGDATETD